MKSRQEEMIFLGVFAIEFQNISFYISNISKQTMQIVTDVGFLFSNFQRDAQIQPKRFWVYYHI